MRKCKDCRNCVACDVKSKMSDRNFFDYEYEGEMFCTDFSPTYHNDIDKKIQEMLFSAIGLYETPNTRGYSIW